MTSSYTAGRIPRTALLVKSTHFTLAMPRLMYFVGLHDSSVRNICPGRDLPNCSSSELSKTSLCRRWLSSARGGFSHRVHGLVSLHHG